MAVVVKELQVKKVTEGMTFDAMPMKRAFVIWGHGYQKLAELTGCSVRTAFNVVNGTTPCSRFARKIAGVLGVDMNDCWKLSSETEDAA